MKDHFDYTLEEVIVEMDLRGYKVFEGPGIYDLNIVGIRTEDDTANTFNDWLVVFYLLEPEGNWVHFAFPATTDPGLYWRENPMNVKGTAILVPGQYRGAYQLGKHRNSYEALQQKAPMKVYRDNNKDEVLDMDVPAEVGFFGINIHRASQTQASGSVNKWSAGCQVIQDPLHFNFFMELCRAATAKFGNSLSYTLLEEKGWGVIS